MPVSELKHGDWHWGLGLITVKVLETIHYSVRDNGVIRKLAAYVVLGINSDGLKVSAKC